MRSRPAAGRLTAGLALTGLALAVATAAAQSRPADAAVRPGVEWHVSTQGDDAHDGSAAHPLRTIGAAAARAMPGDTVTVHGGVYRERVDPPRGGTGDDRRIVYQVAPDEHVTITGAEPVTGWRRESGDVWRVTIPNARFGDFNPFADLIHGDWFDGLKRPHHTAAVYLNGDWLAEAATKASVFAPPKLGPTTRPGDPPNAALWFAEVGDAETTVWAQFPGVDPTTQSTECNARRTVFYPSKAGIDFITVRGFTLTRAATPWAPPTAEQVALIGTNWSRGWVIEGNRISHSVCTGVSLGKYGDAFDNKSASSAGGYVKTIDRALANGWTKGKVGHHVVRDNEISDCEQAGIVGSMGAAFSAITGNSVHDIHVRRRFGGAEMAAIKFHGAIDTLIAGNHLYRSYRGLWLDWMSQGTRVTANLLHDNAFDSDAAKMLPFGGRQDAFLEVNHGPTTVDNNLFLSSVTLNVRSQGTAYVHNLIAGKLILVDYDARVTPFHKPHSTELAGSHDNPSGDVRLLNNVFAGGADLSKYDAPRLAVSAEGNVFLGRATPTTRESEAVRRPDAAGAIRVIERDDGFYLDFAADPAWAAGRPRAIVTGETLGRAVIPDLPFENPDGTPVRIDRDYFGNPRGPAAVFPGPFSSPPVDRSIKVWPLPKRDWSTLVTPAATR